MKTKLTSAPGLLLGGALALNPAPAKAFGLSCDGAGCVWLYVALYGMVVGPYLVGLVCAVLLLLWGIARIRNRKLTAKIFVITGIVSAIVLAYPALLLTSKVATEGASKRYQKRNTEELSKIKFTIYEPAYLPEGYRLVENDVDTYFPAFDYKYYNRQAEPKNSVAKKRIEISQREKSALRETNGSCTFSANTIIRAGEPVRCKRIYKDANHYWFDISDEDTDSGTEDDEHVGIVIRDDTTVIITYTDISKDEVTKIIDGLQKTEHRNIRFHSDWASTR